MTDVMTAKPLRVVPDTTAGPYIDLPFSQLDDLTRLLEKHQIAFEADEEVYSFNDESEVITVYLGRKTDADFVQRIIDDAA